VAATPDDVRALALALPETTEWPAELLTEAWRLRVPVRLRTAFDAAGQARPGRQRDRFRWGPG
jgi:hypothetical protein